MKEKNVTLFSVVLWGLITACWTGTLCVDFAYKSSPKYLVVLHALTAAVSFAAGVVNFLRYRRQKKDEEASGNLC